MARPEFRAVTKEDQEEVRLLIFSTLAEYGLEVAPKSADADLFDLAKYYEDGAFEVLVDASGLLMGTLGLKRLDDHRCELRRMYLTQKHRGKGYGKRMLRRAISRAKELGFSRIELETAGVLDEAISLYKSHGFEPFDHVRSASSCDQAFAMDL